MRARGHYPEARAIDCFLGWECSWCRGGRVGDCGSWWRGWCGVGRREICGVVIFPAIVPNSSRSGRGDLRGLCGVSVRSDVLPFLVRLVDLAAASRRVVAILAASAVGGVVGTTSSACFTVRFQVTLNAAGLAVSTSLANRECVATVNAIVTLGSTYGTVEVIVVVVVFRGSSKEFVVHVVLPVDNVFSMDCKLLGTR